MAGKAAQLYSMEVKTVFPLAVLYFKEHIMKKTLTSIAAVALFSAAGFASAAEPMQLTEAQMDGVSAGSAVIISSSAGGSAGAVLGYANSTSETRLNVLGQTVRSGNSSTAVGLFARARSGANTTIKVFF
jgi:1-aminocyclopropane-1-carboxylate deaminase/D-cysteine desulfhydrase-like pyridoxal-dependent ACC family enzyme